MRRVEEWRSEATTDATPALVTMTVGDYFLFVNRYRTRAKVRSGRSTSSSIHFECSSVIFTRRERSLELPISRGPMITSIAWSH